MFIEKLNELKSKLDYYNIVQTLLEYSNLYTQYATACDNVDKHIRELSANEARLHGFMDLLFRSKQEAVFYCIEGNNVYISRFDGKKYIIEDIIELSNFGEPQKDWVNLTNELNNNLKATYVVFIKNGISIQSELNKNLEIRGRGYTVLDCFTSTISFILKTIKDFGFNIQENEIISSGGKFYKLDAKRVKIEIEEISITYFD